MALRLLLCGTLIGCLAGEPIASQQQSIVDGAVETGRPEVVYLYNIAVRSACTATIIAPRVVLTAKHCVQGGANSASPARNFRVLVGSNSRRADRQYLVEEVRPVPGRWDLRDTSDVAVLILAQAALETPMQVSFDNPREIVGQQFTAVGYGETPSGTVGQKLVTHKRVDGIRDGFIYVRPAVCQGDSGGPLIGSDGRVWGVASFIVSTTGGEPRCGSAPGAYNSLNRYQAFIEQAIMDSGACVPREEVCNSIDDNCDGVVDEGCTPIGAPCTDDSQCVGEHCGVVGESRICTQECDPLRPELGCPADMYCKFADGCGGLCAARAGGTFDLDIGADCTSDNQCFTSFCSDPGDGRQRCLAPCQGNAGMCLSGEVCAAPTDVCGGCVERELVRGSRGIGEPCDTNEECGSGLCFEDEGVRYCSVACTAEAGCVDNFHCRVGETSSVCVRGPLESVGGGCVTNADCGSGICATRGDGIRFCTAICSSAEDCPDLFVCEPVGTDNVCLPSGSLVGEACTGNSECASGLCAAGTAMGSICTRFCSSEQACSPGFECLRIDGGRSAVCIPSEPDEGGGGCAASGEPASGAWLVLLALFGFRRRKK